MEDDFTYVVRKALKGAGITGKDAALRAGLRPEDVEAFTGGRFSEDVARRLAPALGLSAEALARHPGYVPKPHRLHTIRRLDMPFGQDGQVNAWLVREDDVTLLFDTGFSAAACARALDAVQVFRADAVFITHGHRDHTGGLEEVRSRCGTVYAPVSGEFHSAQGIRDIRAGDTVRVGPLTVTAFNLAGHCDGALGYHIGGLAYPVSVVGDALFAGSIGGCGGPETYREALENLRAGVFTLPDRTLLLPGHGPATTVGEERESNPFFPEG